jgi:hypothetical protein
MNPEVKAMWLILAVVFVIFILVLTSVYCFCVRPWNRNRPDNTTFVPHGVTYGSGFTMPTTQYTTYTAQPAPYTAQPAPYTTQPAPYTIPVYTAQIEPHVTYGLPVNTPQPDSFKPTTKIPTVNVV